MLLWLLCVLVALVCLYLLGGLVWFGLTYRQVSREQDRLKREQDRMKAAFEARKARAQNHLNLHHFD